MIFRKKTNSISKTFVLLICVFGLTRLDCKPLRIKQDILTMGYDVKEKLKAEWCTSRKMARQDQCNIVGFSKQFCIGLDMIRHFQLKFGTLILNNYDAENLGELLLDMPCSVYDVIRTDDSNTAIIDIMDFKTNTQRLPTLKGNVQTLNTLDEEVQSKEWMQYLSNSTDENYDNSFEIWIIPTISIIAVYIVIFAFLAHHRIKRLGYLCCKVSELDVVDNSIEHLEKKK